MGSDSQVITPQELRQAAAAVGRELGARLIVLFGSAARRDRPTPEDLDIGVLGRTPLDPVAVTNRFIRLLGVQHVDLSDLSHADPLLLMLVARDGVPLYVAGPGEFERFASLAARRFADTKKFRVAERDALRAFVSRDSTER